MQGCLWIDFDITIVFQMSMLPTKCDWIMLAQCDGQAVKKFVEFGNRPARYVVEPNRFSVFSRHLDSNPVMRTVYGKCCQAYEACKGVFEFKHDEFDGYSLFYAGTEVVPKNTVFRNGPVGLTRIIPPGVSELSILHCLSSGEEMVMLGPLRFANSDCDPNCEYDFTSQSKIVQLKSKTRIRPGDEILVKYGEEFFDKNECLCRTCRNSKTHFMKDNPIAVETIQASSTSRKFFTNI